MGRYGVWVFMTEMIGRVRSAHQFFRPGSTVATRDRRPKGLILTDGASGLDGQAPASGLGDVAVKREAGHLT